MSEELEDWAAQFAELCRCNGFDSFDAGFIGNETFVQRFQRVRDVTERWENMLSKPVEAARSLQERQPWTETSQPILVKDLIVDSTHKGKVLLGKVAVCDAFFTSSSAAILVEDVCGEVVELAVYGMVHSTQQASSIFSRGTLVAVQHPHYKKRRDGSFWIRVDDISDISTWSSPASTLDWKSLGNRFVRDSRNMSGAVCCYQKAVQASNTSTSIALLMSNASECCLRLDRFGDSAIFAAVSLALDMHNIKAHVRLVKSTHRAHGQLRAQRVAAHCLAALSEFGTDEHVTALKGQLEKISDVNFCASSTSPGEWDDILWWCGGPTLAAPWWSAPSELVSNLADWQVSRSDGRAAFAKGDFKAALSHFASGLYVFEESLRELSILFSNSAAAKLLKSSTDSQVAMAGLFESSVAGLLDPTNGKAWRRQGLLLEELGAEDVALRRLEWVSKKSALTPESRKILLTEVQRLRSKAARNDLPKKSQVPSTEAQLTDREAKEQMQGNLSGEPDLDSEIAECEFTAMMYDPVKHAPESAEIPSVWQGALAKRNVPELHKEFANQVGWPAGIDANKAHKLLYREHLRSTMLPWFIQGMMRIGQFQYDMQMALKRWNGPFVLKEVLTGAPLQPGQVVDVRHKCGSHYAENIRSNFANNPNGQVCMFHGTTHIAIGFNDLGALLNLKVGQPCEKELQGKPMTFLGLDMNEFSVAKSLVVAELLGSDCPLKALLQVWFSSSWTRATAEHFRNASKACLSRMLKDKGKCRSRTKSLQIYSEGVANYLKHWTIALPISAEQARHKWLSLAARDDSSFSGLTSCARQVDRLALAGYRLTGEVLGGDSAEVGSLAMWSVPEGSPPLVADSIFNMYLVPVFVESHKKKPALSMVDLFVDIVLGPLETLRGLVKTGTLHIDLYVGKLEPLGASNQGDTLADDIASLRPYTFSWSNVIDYFELPKFHDLARHLSQHGDAMHSAYSMNWFAEVFGVSIGDHLLGTPTLNPVSHLGMIFAPPSSPEARKKLQEVNVFLDKLTSSHDTALKAGGLDTLFSIPYFTTPINTLGWSLAAAMYPKWLDHFYAQASTAKMTHCKRTPANMGLERAAEAEQVLTICPLQDSTCAVYMTWGYDPQLKFAL